MACTLWLKFISRKNEQRKVEVACTRLWFPWVFLLRKFRSQNCINLQRNYLKIRFHDNLLLAFVQMTMIAYRLRDSCHCFVLALFLCLKLCLFSFFYSLLFGSSVVFLFILHWDPIVMCEWGEISEILTIKLCHCLMHSNGKLLTKRTVSLTFQFEIMSFIWMWCLFASKTSPKNDASNIFWMSFVLHVDVTLRVFIFSSVHFLLQFQNDKMKWLLLFVSGVVVCERRGSPQPSRT